MNQELKKLLLELDQFHDQMSEHSISCKINRVTSEDQSLEVIAERIAFSFCEDYLDKNTSWGTYFGPMMVWTGDNGQVYENPSLSHINKDIVLYWIDRSERTNNPLMKARYSGLVWDLTKKVLNDNPDYLIAIRYINSLIEVCDQNLCEHPTEAIKK